MAIAHRGRDVAPPGAVQGRVDTAYRDELIGRFDLDPSKKVRAYSKGNKQKILLIAALMARPDLLVLDEPTSGLDPLMEQAFRHSVHEARKAGQTVFLSSHILSEVEALCDRVGILREGRLVEMGTLEEMQHLSTLTVEATFGGCRRRPHWPASGSSPRTSSRRPRRCSPPRRNGSTVK
jgi:ABC-2 type transport system ATP-binding protein